MVEKETVRRGYDALAETYAAERSPEENEREVLAQFEQSLPAQPRVLDAGCGCGEPILRRLSEMGHAVGIDISREQLGFASQNASKATLCQGDITALPFEDDTFDAAIVAHSLIHVPRGQHQQAIEEFARVLAPGGQLLLTEGTGTDGWHGENPDWFGAGVEMQWHIEGAETTREQLRAAGFTIETEWVVPDELGDGGGKWRFFRCEK